MAFTTGLLENLKYFRRAVKLLDNTDRNILHPTFNLFLHLVGPLSNGKSQTHLESRA
jgi:hypothetical protein